MTMAKTKGRKETERPMELGAPPEVLRKLFGEIDLVEPRVVETVFRTTPAASWFMSVVTARLPWAQVALDEDDEGKTCRVRIEFPERDENEAMTMYALGVVAGARAMAAGR